MAQVQVQEALAFLQKTSTTDGGSLFEELSKLVIKASMQHGRSFEYHTRAACELNTRTAAYARC